MQNDSRFKAVVFKCNTVEPQYSARDWEISKSMLYQSVHYIEVLYNITLELNLNLSRHTTTNIYSASQSPHLCGNPHKTGHPRKMHKPRISSVS